MQLPTAEQLERLPLRAIVAYACQTASRLSSELRGVVPDEILDDALQRPRAVTTSHSIKELDESSIVRASQRLAEAYEATPTDKQLLKHVRIVFSITHTAMAAMRTYEAAVSDNARALHHRKRAADEANRAVTAVAGRSVEEAAQRDYEILLAAYGEHDEPILGAPVHCFDESVE